MQKVVPTLICLTLILINCTQRHDDLLQVREAIPTASLTIISPRQDINYTKGDSISVKALAISTDELHGYDIGIYDAGTGVNLYYTHIHDHRDTLLIDEKWKSELGSPSALAAEVTIYLDHEGHTKKERVNFTIQ
jgi:hypothetical protein